MRLFCAVLVAAALAAFPTILVPRSDDCANLSAKLGGCVSASIGDDQLTLTGNKHSGGGTGNKSGSGGGKHTKTTQPDCDKVPEACDHFGVIAPGAPGNPGVNISDLKNFKPVPGTNHMEPNGWMVVGLSTNFYSVVGTEVEHGTLLGNPADVRFTPISWHWTYGDGSAATRSTPGRTWAAQRITAFDPTRTSHVYSHPGTYFIDLDITFRAEYRYDGGLWLPVTGTLTLPANRLKATAGSAKTVLVARDCTQNPGGPGC